MQGDVDKLNEELAEYFDKKEEPEHPSFIIRSKKENIKKSVLRDKYGDFWYTYCKHINEEKDANIKQVRIEASTFIVQIKQRLNNEEIFDVVRQVQEYLFNMFEYGYTNDSTVHCIVTGSRKSTTLYFPTCRLMTDDIVKTYLPAVAQILAAYTITLNLYDAVPLYGSGIEKFIIAYDYIEVPDGATPAMIEEVKGEALATSDDFDPQAHTKVDYELIDSTIFEKTRPEWFWLPLILSVDYWHTITKLRDISAIYRDDFQKERKIWDIERMIANESLIDDNNTTRDCVKFIEMWTPDRIVDQRYWKLVGEALFTSERGEQGGMVIWMRLIRAALEKAKPGNYMSRGNIRRRLDEAYGTFQIGRTSIKTLAQYAKKDSPYDYEQWHNAWLTEALTVSVPCASLVVTEADVGRGYYRWKWLEYICGDNGNTSIWFKAQDHRLKRDFRGISLRSEMSNGFLRLYNRMRSDIAEMGRETLSKPKIDLALAGVQKVIDALKKQSFKRRLLDELEEKFRMENILSFLDQNPDLTCVTNGVIVASESDIFIRPGIPEDFITKVAGAAYRSDFSWDHPIVCEVINWAQMTFVDPETIKYHFKFLSSLLRGGNNDKKLYIWSGKNGSNSKTTWEEAVLLVMKDYAIKMPINYFTSGKGKANDASPAEARLDGVRVMFSEEPDERVPLLVSVIKSETGNDTKPVRKLYEEGKDIIPQHKTVIVCNIVPVIPKEEAIEDRVAVTPYESQMVYDAPADLAEQIAKRKFPRDPFFGRKLRKLAPGIMWLMYNYYALYVEEGMKNPPADVIRITQQYWDANDRYKLFINENIEDDPESSVEAYDLYNQFSTWHLKNYKRLDVPGKELAMIEFALKFKDIQVDGAWHGKKLKIR
jgi:phage/plasmid-associated DNA primase